MGTGHAFLSPSGASIWLNCTPAARLAEPFADTAGRAADEGTLAHRLGELFLRYRTGKITKKVYQKDLKEIQADELYEASMYEYCDNYAVFVLEKYAEAQAVSKDALLVLEQLYDLTAFIPDGFGTGDATTIGDGVLTIVDLKYGKGVPVSAVENKQLRLYALGALLAYGFIFDIHTVRMFIYQPRLESVTVDEMAADDLLAWAENEVKVKALMAFNGEGDFVPGTHCRFCKAAGMCKANAAYNLELARHEFKSAQLLNDTDISEILQRTGLFTTWLKAVNDHAFNEALKGKKWPGFKLVAGRSNRKLGDEQLVAARLLSDGLEESDIYKKELLGLTALEGLIGEKTVKLLLGDLITKPEGKPTLVEATDKREELNTLAAAVDEFKHLIEQDF